MSSSGSGGHRRSRILQALVLVAALAFVVGQNLVPPGTRIVHEVAVELGDLVPLPAGPPPYEVEPSVVIEKRQARSLPRVAAAAGVPTRLDVPRLGVRAPVIGIGVVDGVLLPPDDPQTLGWWTQGAKPGAARGGALITGHTVHTGGGAFDELARLDAGDEVQVRTRDGRIRYHVTDVTVYPKASLAQKAGEVFSQSVKGRLVLITCEDWNGSGYDSNSVVIAERRA